MAKSQVFFGGLPTKIDTKKLADRYGIPEAGTLIAHEEIATTIGSPWKSTRYTTVLNAWRKTLRADHNVDTSVEPGEGLRILLPDERVGVVVADFVRNARGIKRSAIRGATIDENGIVDPARKAQLGKHREVTGRLMLTLSSDARALNIRPPGAPGALPRAR